MKKTAYLVAIAALFTAAACSRTALEEASSITLSQKRFEVESTATSVEVTVNSNCDWTAFHPSCVIVPSSGEAGETKVTISFGESASLEANTYVVDFTSWDKKIEKYVVISQEGAQSRLELEKSEATLAYDEVSATCKVSSNCTWKVKTPEGVTASVPMGEGDAEVSFSVGENISPSDRLFEVVFEANGIEAVFKIAQKAPVTLIYAGEEYQIRAMKDGKVWMAENLRYVPAGYTPCKDLTNVKGGVYCPIVVNSGAASFSEDPAVIKSNGYLYQSEVALGLKVGDITTEEQAKSLAGARGICPEGWHIPTYDDYNDLFGYMNAATKSTAPYFDGGRKTVAKLNADGFNISACGAVSIGDVTKTAATLTGALSGYSERVSSGFYAGSSFYKLTPTEAGSTQIKNVQFWGGMIMTNKSAESEYTFNGSYTAFRMGVAVRCVRDSK